MRSKMNGVVDGPRGMPQISYPPAPPDEGAAFTSTNPSKQEEATRTFFVSHRSQINHRI